MDSYLCEGHPPSAISAKHRWVTRTKFSASSTVPQLPHFAHRAKLSAAFLRLWNSTTFMQCMVVAQGFCRITRSVPRARHSEPTLT